jgi:hypothetical protein
MVDLYIPSCVLQFLQVGVAHLQVIGGLALSVTILWDYVS